MPFIPSCSITFTKSTWWFPQPSMATNAASARIASAISAVLFAVYILSSQTSDTPSIIMPGNSISLSLRNSLVTGQLKWCNVVILILGPNPISISFCKKLITKSCTNQYRTWLCSFQAHWSYATLFTASYIVPIFIRKNFCSVKTRAIAYPFQRFF